MRKKYTKPEIVTKEFDLRNDVLLSGITINIDNNDWSQGDADSFTSWVNE